MSAPGPSTRPPLPAVGDRRGLTATGAVALALLAGLIGGAVDVLTGPGLREVFAVAFVSGCLAAAALVHREDLVATVVMPPLVYVVLALVAGAVERTVGTSGSFLTQQVLELANALVLGAPVLMAATLAALVVAVVRWSTGRR